MSLINWLAKAAAALVPTTIPPKSVPKVTNTQSPWRCGRKIKPRKVPDDTLSEDQDQPR